LYPNRELLRWLFSDSGLRIFMILYQSHLFLYLCEIEEVIFMTVVWMWNALNIEQRVLQFYFSFTPYRHLNYKLLPMFIHLKFKSSKDALAIHMHNASSSIKMANIYQTLGRLFHHKPSTLNCISIGLCSTIMWALF